MTKLGRSVRILGGAILLSVIYWILDGVLGFYIFNGDQQAALSDTPADLLGWLLLRVPPYALLMRIGFLVAVITGGILAVVIFEKRLMAQEALCQSEAKFAQLFQSTRQAIILHRLSDGVILEASDACRQVFGYSREALVGRRLFDIGLMKPEDHERGVRLLQEGGFYGDLEARFTTQSGQERVGLFSGHMIDVGGEPCIVQVVDDITARAQAEAALVRSEATLRSVFRAAPIGIGVVRDRVFVWVNERLEAMLGYPSEELIGQRSRLVYESDEEFERVGRVKYAQISEEGVGSTTTRLRRKDGSMIDVLLSSALINPADPSEGVTFTVMDISESMRTAKALETRNRALQTLNEVALDISAELAMPTLLRRIMERAVALLNAETGALYLYEPETNVLRVAEAYAAEGLVGVAQRVDAGASGMVFQTRRPFVIDDYGRWEGRIYHDEALTSVLEVPLFWHEQVIGVIALNAGRQRPAFDPDDVWLAETFAAQAAVAIKNAQLYQQLEHYSDSLMKAVQERTAELQRVKDRVEAILNNSPDAILLLRADGMIELSNQAFCDLFGYYDDEAFARPPSILVEASHADSFNATLRAAMEHGVGGRLEVVARRKDGTTFDADVAIACIKAGDTVANLVCSLRDITALKEVQRLKDQFVSNVSHELRTPITSLKLYQDLLARNPDKHHLYLARLERETSRLNHIIETLLQFSRLDQGRAELRFAPLDLNMLTDQYVTDRQPLAQQKGLTLLLEREADLPPVQADARLIGQVLSILLTNAINYTPEGGQVVVSTCTRRDSGKAWIGMRVSDNGPGIAPDDMAHLFERFFRGKVGIESGAPGTGLGLALAKEIVERHQGKIEVLSEGTPGQGATFTVWLPTGS